MEKIKYIPVLIRFEQDSYRSLRKLAYLKEQSMADITREAVNNLLKESKKVLINSDIAI